MKFKILFLLLTFHFLLPKSYAQQAVPYFKGATEERRTEEYRNIINNVINKNLSLPISDSTEENWEDAFWAMELVQYKSPWADNHIRTAFDSAENRSAEFQYSLLELAYANYPKTFDNHVNKLLKHAKDRKSFALGVEYLWLDSFKSITQADFEVIGNVLVTNLKYEKPDPILKQAMSHLYFSFIADKKNKLALPNLLKKDFLPKNVLVISFQRKDRNYPGLAIVRDTAGNFITNIDGSIFSVPQLARSVGNTPYYLTNGNTPQGLFRMDGFDVSKADYIGPTENIQLTMPFETSIKHFLKDSTITDTTWSVDLYQKLFPAEIKDSDFIFESYYAGAAGRTEIIAHGTTVNPEYYHGKIFYPLTPTQGCLCTKEIWSNVDGKRLYSDQQKLVDAVKKAGGADGYYLVINLDDQQKPVEIEEILPFINK